MQEPPTLASLIPQVLAAANDRPLAFVLSGHNGSGKSTDFKPSTMLTKGKKRFVRIRLGEWSS